MGNLKNIPELRFPEFKGEWKVKKFGELTERISNPVKVELEKMYQQIGIRSHGKGIFHKEFVDGKTLGNKRVFWVKEDVLIVNIVFAWEQAVAKTTKNELGMIASHRFPMYLPIKTQSDLDYLLCFFLTKRGKSLLELASPGGAGRNKTLGQKEFENLKFLIPEVAEQNKIALFLSAIESKLNALKQKKSLLEQYKKGVMQKLFSQELRFKDDNGKEFPKWEKKKLGEIAFKNSSNIAANAIEDNFGDYVIYGASGVLKKVDFYREEEEYISIVKDGAGVGRVFLCAAKSSVLGTLDIIKPIGGNLHYLFYFLQQSNFLKYVTGSTIPHIYFSDYKTEKILFPCIKEQTKIANFLFAIDEKINRTENQIQQTQQYKKGLLQNMFI